MNKTAIFLPLTPALSLTRIVVGSLDLRGPRWREPNNYDDGSSSRKRSSRSSGILQHPIPCMDWLAGMRGCPEAAARRPSGTCTVASDTMGVLAPRRSGDFSCNTYLLLSSVRYGWHEVVLDALARCIHLAVLG